MGKRNKSKKRVETTAATSATHNPFAGALAGLTAPEADLPEQAAKPSAPAPVPAGRVRTRRERKGHGGKTVTIVEGLDPLGAEEREELARQLRQALGTGARVDADTIVVQGDVGDRVEAWFEARESDDV